VQNAKSKAKEKSVHSEFGLEVLKISLSTPDCLDAKNKLAWN